MANSHSLVNNGTLDAQAPEGWGRVPLEELVFLDREKLSEGTRPDFSFYYIDITSASEGRLQLPATKISFRGSPSRARKVVHGSDVLMSTVRPNLKAFAYFDHTNDDCIASTGFAVLTAKEGVNPRFILYSILSNEVSAQIEAHVVGSNYPALNSKDVRCLQIMRPPPPEQQKIARILTTLDNLIERTEALIAKHQTVKQGMMYDLFTRGVDEHGHLRPSYTEVPDLYKSSELGWIPKEWKVLSLGESCSLIKDGTHLPPPRVASGPLLLSVQNLIDGKLTPTSSDTRVPAEFFAMMHRTWQISQGDVLLAIVGATIGKVCEVPKDFEQFSIQRSLCLFRGRDNVLNNCFLFFYMTTQPFQTALWSRANQTAQPGVYLAELGQLVTPLPSFAEQNEIAARLNAIKQNIEAEERYLQNLRSQKTGLMQDLLTGKVRVTVDESEEVAAHA